MPIKEEIISSIGEEEYKSRLEGKLGEYHHLIRRDAAEYLLSLEIFGTKARHADIAAAEMAQVPVILRVRADKVFPQKIIEKGAQVSRTQRMHSSDHSGSATIVAYDAIASKISQAVLSGDLIEVGPVRFRAGEFHIMPSGEIKRLQKGKREKLIGQAPQIGNFDGIVKEVFGDFPYRRQMRLAGGSYDGLMTSFSISSGEESARVVYWDSPGLALELKPGMQIEIENGVRKPNGEIHISSQSRLVYAKADEDERRPKIESIEINGSTASVRAGSISIEFESLEDACQKFGIGQVPDGVKPETLIELKKKDLIGKALPKSWEKK